MPYVFAHLFAGILWSKTVAFSLEKLFFWVNEWCSLCTKQIPSSPNPFSHPHRFSHHVPLSCFAKMQQGLDKTSELMRLGTNSRKTFSPIDKKRKRFFDVVVSRPIIITFEKCHRWIIFFSMSATDPRGQIWWCIPSFLCSVKQKREFLSLTPIHNAAYILTPFNIATTLFLPPSLDPIFCRRKKFCVLRHLLQKPAPYIWTQNILSSYFPFEKHFSFSAQILVEHVIVLLPRSWQKVIGIIMQRWNSSVTFRVPAL